TASAWSAERSVRSTESRSARSSSSERCSASQREVVLTIRSPTRMVSGLVDIGRQENVLSNPARLETAQRDRLVQLGEQRRPRAGYRGRDDDEQLVEQASAQECGGQRVPTL